MRKILFTAMLFIIVMFMALNCIAQTDYQSFALRVNGNDTTVNLPKDVPSMANAKFVAEQCYDAYLCVDHYAINDEETLIISFWHHKGKVIGFVLHDLTQDITEHMPWLYADDTPTLATVDEFNAKLTELYQGG